MVATLIFNLPTELMTKINYEVCYIPENLLPWYTWEYSNSQ